MPVDIKKLARGVLALQLEEERLCAEMQKASSVQVIQHAFRLYIERAYPDVRKSKRSARRG